MKTYDGSLRNYVNLSGTLSFNESLNNCSGNSQCESLCCIHEQCKDIGFCGKLSSSFSHTQIICIMIILIALLIAIALYIHCIAKNRTIKNVGVYGGKHTYLSRKPNISSERLIQPNMVKLKSPRRIIPSQKIRTHQFKSISVINV